LLIILFDEIDENDENELRAIYVKLRAIYVKPWELRELKVVSDDETLAQGAQGAQGYIAQDFQG